MTLDSYSLCPGGTGKKIKFCCSDLLADLKTITRMMEGDQYAAALRHIESIESADKPRACLLALKIQLFQAMDHEEDARAVVKHFVEHFPDNPIALAETAIDLAVEGDGPAAMGMLQRALAASSEQLYPQVYDAMSAVAQRMANSGFLASARALWHLQTAANKNDEQPGELLARISRSESVPLLLKSEPPVVASPADAALAEQFEEAMKPLVKAHWAEAAERLEKLAEQVPGEPVVWRNLAVVRAWLADREGAIEAYNQYASLDVPLEDAVEAAATAMLMSDDPLDDSIDALRLVYRVENADELAGHISTWKHAVITPVDPSMLGREEEVPPKLAFWLLDRPALDSAESLSLDDLPKVLGQALLYGRQTDREARLEILGVNAADTQNITSLLSGIAEGSVTGPPEEEVVGQLSAGRMVLRRPWRLPPEIQPETVRKLAEQHLEKAVLEQWPEVKLGVLGGRSAREAAGDEDQKIRLLAAIMVFEDWVRQMGEQFDFNRLRDQLGLPTLGPIDPEQTPREEVPLVRLPRVMVDKLPDDRLLYGFHRAVVFGVQKAVVVFGRELIERPQIAAKDRQLALAALAQNESDPERALDYIRRGREVAESQGNSSAPWDLNELEYWMGQGNADQAGQLFNHLRQDHLREPGVAEALRTFLYRAGAVDAQGRPIEPEPAAAAEQPEEESSGLWTPDSEKPSGAKSKLWTPDME